jgi:5-methylcytosine-specific restriction protein A
VLADQQALIRREVEEGTGALIGLEVSNPGVQQGLKLWFDDLGRARSPIVELRPKGLSRYEAWLSFGNFAAETVKQMMHAADEEKQLARALVRSVATDADVVCKDQSLDDWEVRGPDFTIVAERRGVHDRFGEEALTETCRKIVTPMLAAMAELYGYDPVEDPAVAGAEALMEGTVRLSQVKRRERNPRNRLLCLRIHGNKCAVCDADPAAVYGEAGNVIEVHHIQPLSLGDGPRPYNPEIDLIPLCPTCHRAAHTRRPVPWSPDELRGLLKSNACVA